MAMSTMEVGVETFSLTLAREESGTGIEARERLGQGIFHLKSRDRIEKEQMSTPLPATELKVPPRKPTPNSTAACQAPKLGMASKVRRLCSLGAGGAGDRGRRHLFSRKRAKAKLNQIQTKPSFFSGGDSAVSTTCGELENFLFRVPRDLQSEDHAHGGAQAAVD